MCFRVSTLIENIVGTYNESKTILYKLYKLKLLDKAKSCFFLIYSYTKIYYNCKKIIFKVRENIMHSFDKINNKKKMLIGYQSPY